ncbi:endonuclease III [Candidatus Peregrinibacteria bacterium CG22_combo_CG10-13_8_21_14_all_44_10]|nr:MAG: endonuclease III [Candidatus Peregrinibacteria bacterium CG2_30_44_17]PIP66173.1 MAG: endonuclease III [Candidatus Peregrinibacteria bacterium CG22_combo_CG10-13_8_21_14_all_44_10]PIS03900.1 MAG: endonuclease III [Candidatus Peregrinibacteria bacterium CG10_big_fil_rev_8_21_14_0_10_44_7]PIX79995.1 MAG: endonuclease III [Candidatus Peregrinibacteria bacterium CG_4_10_14_3_um_filter_44_21]PJB88980.1 MAG: endonuclease III [Candidatus Peregrinibacteria bacterium CG_4_9_14_0_8_um_filter_44_1
MKIAEILEKLYPDPQPTLDWNTPFEALIAVMLSAQCTDIKVNKVTAVLFKKANTPATILSIGQKRLSEIIKPCGLFNAKSKAIIGTCKALKGNNIPNTFTELTALPGVGEKTAQVILAQVFNKPAFPVDTHIHRIANRLGICRTKTATQTSDCLKKKVPQKYWHNMHLQLIFHGRGTCTARSPKCEECKLKEFCSYYRTRTPKAYTSSSSLGTE